MPRGILSDAEVASIRRYIERGQHSEVARAIQALLQDESAAKQLVQSVERRLDRDPFILTTDELVSFIALTKSRSLFQANKRRIIEDCFASSHLLAKGFKDSEVEKKLLDTLDDVSMKCWSAPEELKIRGSPILNALHSNGGAATIDRLEVIRYDLMPKLQARLVTDQGTTPTDWNRGVPIDTILHDLQTKCLRDFVSALDDTIKELRLRWLDVGAADDDAKTEGVADVDEQAKEVRTTLARAKDHLLKGESELHREDILDCLTACRRASEAALKGLCQVLRLSFRKIDTATLEDLISRLRDEPNCSRIVELAKSIQARANPGAHDQRNLSNDYKLSDAKNVLSDTGRLVEMVESDVAHLGGSSDRAS